MANPEVSIIGSGNLATNLAVALENAGIVINEVYSRNPSNAERLTNRLYQAEAIESLNFKESTSTVFILLVSDESISPIADQIILPSNDCILVHTSGSIPLNAIEQIHQNCGVIYPLQTFTADKLVEFTEVPLLIEASNKKAEKILLGTAQAISKEVFLVDSESREIIHMAAVFASNFTNHMLHIAEGILQEIDLDIHMLAPLIKETVEKSMLHGPKKTQTGPARRNDLLVMNRHLKKLKDDQELAVIYKKISEHIINKYH